MRLVTSGDVASARTLCRSPSAKSHALSKPSAGVQLAERLRDGDLLLRELNLLSGDDTESAADGRTGLIVFRSATATRLAVVFSGNAPFFTLPYPLAVNDDIHIIMIRDPTRCFGFLGIPGLGSTYQDCLTNIRRLTVALGAQETYCIGLSAGGSTAMKMGTDLEANGVLGFSVPTTLDLHDDDGADLRAYPQLARLYKHARHLGIDLVAYYATKVTRPRMLLVYSARHKRDAWLAERTCGVPGIELVKIDQFDGHATYRWILDNQALEPLFDRLFLLQPLTLNESRCDNEYTSVLA